jgi:ATP-dependent 26S proteasome regulatory subunit
LIEQAVTLARDLAPATVVLEDVDLVAAERTMPMGDNGVLFELLNQMEGLAEDSDLLFLLTTNRADVIEPALATRPGRIDLALETPLPDEACRRALVRLYAGSVQRDAPRLRCRRPPDTNRFPTRLTCGYAVRIAVRIGERRHGYPSPFASTWQR